MEVGGCLHSTGEFPLLAEPEEPFVLQCSVAEPLRFACDCEFEVELVDVDAGKL